MQDFLTVLVQLLPYLMIVGAALYMFHEGMRFIERRGTWQKRREVSTQVMHNDKEGRAFQLAQLELQAAERFALYLERIAPDRLVMRLHQNGMSARILQTEMLRAIREEFDHNLSQQVYLSDPAWKLIKDAKEEMVTFITKMGDTMRENSTGIDLSRKIFETASRVENLPTDIALRQIRKDCQIILKGG
jgi:hypothetical protein